MEQAIADRARDGNTRKQSPHGEAWGALTRTHAAIVQRLQEMLSAADFPPLPWYEVLATVSEEFYENAEMVAFVKQVLLSNEHPQQPEGFERQAGIDFPWRIEVFATQHPLLRRVEVQVGDPANRGRVLRTLGGVLPRER